VRRNKGAQFEAGIRMISLSFANVIELSFNSLSYAALLFLLASGLSLIFGVMRIVNLAHAAIFLFAGYISLEFYNIIYGDASILPRIIQALAWAALYFAWHSLSKVSGEGRATLGILGAYIVIEIITSTIWGFNFYELFFPVIKVQKIDKVSFLALSAAIAVSVVMVALGGMFIERFFLRRFGQDTLAQVLVTIGFAFILQDGSLYTWGGDNFIFESPWPFNSSAVIGGISFPLYRLLMIIIAVLVGISLFFGIDRTRLGAIMRATVDDPEMARGIGINTNIVSMSIFAIGALLAAIGGVVGGAFFGVYPGLDFEILPYAFAVVIIGGLGSLVGAVVGSLVVGFMENFGTALFPELSYFALFAPMAIILAIKPTGLFGKG
jgi:branched-chain amino acid transport system permease protein